MSFGDDSYDTRLAPAPSPIASDEETVHGIHMLQSFLSSLDIAHADHPDFFDNRHISSPYIFYKTSFYTSMIIAQYYNPVLYSLYTVLSSSLINLYCIDTLQYF